MPLAITGDTVHENHVPPAAKLARLPVRGWRRRATPAARRPPAGYWGARKTNKERVIFPFKSPASVAPLPTMPRAHDSWVMKCAAWRAITLGVRIVERSRGFSGGTDSIRIHIQERDFDGVLVYVGLGGRAGYGGWTSIKGDGKGVRNIWPILYFVNFSVNIAVATEIRQNVL